MIKQGQSAITDKNIYFFKWEANWLKNQYVLKVEAYVAAKISNRGIDSLMEFPLDDPSSVVGTALDPVPASEVQLKWLTRTGVKSGNQTEKA